MFLFPLLLADFLKDEKLLSSEQYNIERSRIFGKIKSGKIEKWHELFNFFVTQQEWEEFICEGQCQTIHVLMV